MFDRAVEGRAPGKNDIVPYWVFDEGQAKIERRIPLLPFSKEVQKLELLKRGLALYRLVFGQPRQEELIAFLAANLGEDAINEATRTLPISLEPPSFRKGVGGSLVTVVDGNF